MSEYINPLNDPALDDQVEHPDEGTGPVEQTGIDLILESAAKITSRVGAHYVEGPPLGFIEAFELLRDMRASYLTFLYEQQRYIGETE